MLHVHWLVHPHCNLQLQLLIFWALGHVRFVPFRSLTLAIHSISLETGNKLEYNPEVLLICSFFDVVLYNFATFCSLLLQKSKLGNWISFSEMKIRPLSTLSSDFLSIIKNRYYSNHNTYFWGERGWSDNDLANEEYGDTYWQIHIIYAYYALHRYTNSITST